MPRIYFSRQDQNLLFITWWFKEHNVVGIETDISSFFALVKYILNNMDHRQISAMTPFREEIGNTFISPWLIHKIVEDNNTAKTEKKRRLMHSAHVLTQMSCWRAGRWMNIMYMKCTVNMYLDRFCHCVYTFKL